jgi:hypothetical protein
LAQRLRGLDSGVDGPSGARERVNHGGGVPDTREAAGRLGVASGEDSPFGNFEVDEGRAVSGARGDGERRRHRAPRQLSDVA